MIRLRQTLRGAGALAALALLLGPAPAAAIPLGALTAGGTLTTADGALTFDGFTVGYVDPIGEMDNALFGLDLSLFEVELAVAGDWHTLAFSGPLALPPGALGHVQIGYRVHAGAGYAIDAAVLALEAKVSDPYSFVGVGEAIAGGAIATLSLVAEQPVDAPPPAAVAFDAPATTLDVRTDVWVDGGFLDGTVVTRLEQGFAVSGGSTPVPEPGAALLFGVGVGLVATRVRRISRR